MRRRDLRRTTPGIAIRRRQVHQLGRLCQPREVRIQQAGHPVAQEQRLEDAVAPNSTRSSACSNGASGSWSSPPTVTTTDMGSAVSDRTVERVTAVPAPASSPDAGATWHYGDPLGEQRAALTDAVAIDRSHRGVITLTGPERLSWLHNISSQHVANLADGATVENLSLDGQGRVEDHWIQTELRGVSFLDTEPWRAEPLLAYLKRMVFWADVVPDAADHGILRFSVRRWPTRRCSTRSDSIRPWKRSITVSRLMRMAIVSGTSLVTTMATLTGSAGAQRICRHSRGPPARRYAVRSMSRRRSKGAVHQSGGACLRRYRKPPRDDRDRAHGRATDLASVDAKHHRSGPRCGKYHRVHSEPETHAVIRVGAQRAFERLAMG